MYSCVGQPICCPPQYCVQDYYTQRIVPVIHPIVNINRQNIVDVPQHYYQMMARNVIVDPGYQGDPGIQGYRGYQGYTGNSNRLFAQPFHSANCQCSSCCEY
jgi:spore coat protein D